MRANKRISQNKYDQILITKGGSATWSFACEAKVFTRALQDLSVEVLVGILFVGGGAVAWTLRRYFANEVCYDLVRDKGRAADRSDGSEGRVPAPAGRGEGQIGEIGQIGRAGKQARGREPDPDQTDRTDRREQTVWQGVIDRYCVPWQRHFATIPDAILQRGCKLSFCV